MAILISTKTDFKSKKFFNGYRVSVLQDEKSSGYG